MQASFCSQTNGQLWYVDGEEKIEERAFVGTWSNYDTWLDVVATSQ